MSVASVFGVSDANKIEADAIVEDLNIKIRGHIARLYRCSESIALLDMV